MSGNVPSPKGGEILRSWHAAINPNADKGPPGGLTLSAALRKGDIAHHRRTIADAEARIAEAKAELIRLGEPS